MAKRTDIKRDRPVTPGRKRRRRKPRQEPVLETLYDRVTGQTQEVAIHHAAARPVRCQLTVALRPDQRATLEELKDTIASTTGATLPAAAFIRGILDAVADARLKLTGCQTEADVKATVLARLTRR